MKKTTLVKEMLQKQQRNVHKYILVVKRQRLMHLGLDSVPVF